MRPLAAAATFSLIAIAIIAVPHVFSRKKTAVVKPNTVANVSKKANNELLKEEAALTDSHSAVKTTKANPLMTKRSHSERNEFVYEPQKSETFTAAQGTKITIPEHAFVDEQTEAPITGPVGIKVHEYYAMDDILLNDLHTMSENGLLETNGMINVLATANGRPCKLADGKTADIGFPMVNNKPDMQMFWKDQDDINAVWNSFSYQLVRGFIEPTDGQPRSSDPNLNKVPTLSRGLVSLKSYLDQSIMIPFDSWNGTMNVEVLVAPYGATEQVKVLNEISAEATAQVGLALKKLQWKRGIKNGSPDWFKGQLSIEYKKNKGITSIKFLQPFKHEAFTNRGVTLAGVRTFPVSRLGWINCDRFLLFTKKNNFVIRSPEVSYADVKIVFGNFKSILPAKGGPSEYRLDSVPSNEPITVIAIKKEKGNYLVALASTNTSAATMPCLDYVLVSKEQLKGIILKLDKISKPIPSTTAMR